MSGRRVLGAAVVWLAVVASVSALVWVVISRAGNDLVTSNEPVTTTEGATSPARRTPSGAPSHRPPHSPSHTPTRTPSTDASPTPGTDDPTPSPTSSPSSTSATPASPASPTTPPPSATPVGQPSPTPTARRSTWQGRAGSIEVSCGGAGIRLVSAQPATGFRAEVHREDDRIEVDFEGREDEDGTKITVVARCQGGVPSFSVATEND